MDIVIVGGGTAGWMAGVALSGALPPEKYRIRLVESDAIGTVGVGEATIPQLWAFNETFGIDEARLMRETNATFKLGIEFVDWGKKDTSYIHSFSKYGQPIYGTPFEQQWLRVFGERGITDLEAFSPGIVLSRQNGFGHPSAYPEANRLYNYAYHFDTHLYAKHLRRLAERNGLRRTEGRISAVGQDPENGQITSVTLESGEVIKGDYFLDCSGFSGLLISGTLDEKFDEWTDVLPCDRAVAVGCERSDPLLPYTKATAREAGWQWRIPLQHRTGNGYVYASGLLSDDEAAATLLQRLDGKPLGDPRFLTFTAGRRRRSWVRNCVAVGLSSGFLEPLESTSIYLIQQAVMTFIDLLPTDRNDLTSAAEFNRRMDVEYERIRDFLILHYHATERTDTELWRYTRQMTVPDSLQEKIELFRHRGYIEVYENGLFGLQSWLSVFLGQGITPKRHDLVADNIDVSKAAEMIEKIRNQTKESVASMPSHHEMISQYCAAQSGHMAGA